MSPDLTARAALTPIEHEIDHVLLIVGDLTFRLAYAAPTWTAGHDRLDEVRVFLERWRDGIAALKER